MNLYKNFIEFSVLPEDTVYDALEKLESSKHKVIYVIDLSNRLLGTFSDGDFRRCLLKNPDLSVSSQINQVYNTQFFSMNYEASNFDIQQELMHRSFSIPLVDSKGHLVAVVEKGAKFFSINGRRISNEDPAYVIAEIGNNHQGDLVLAKKLVDLAIDSNADCVKFQMRSMSDLYGSTIRDKNIANHDLGSQYTLDLLTKFQLSRKEYFELFDYCELKNITALCTPWDMASFEVLENIGVPGYKVASADFTNYELLGAIAETAKTMICSTGMSSEDEIRETVAFLDRKKANYILMHCNSTYPTPFKDINLSYLKSLKAISSSKIIGYSGHERGIFIPTVAVALGAKVIEKHFTVDKNLEGNDHKVSLLPDEFKLMVQQIRSVELSMGASSERRVSQGELINREVLAKSIIAKRDILKNEIIESSMLDIKGPGNGLQPNKFSKLIGMPATRDMLAGDMFFKSDLYGSIKKKQKYKFNRPYGIPVRYHDYKKLVANIELDFVEFHLSYSDLDLRLDEYLKENNSIGYAVHAPELFRNDHLLDLASFDKKYLNESVFNLNKVIEHALKLKKYFPLVSKPVLVLNAGGWSKDGFLQKDEISDKYNLLRDTLAKIDTSEIILAIQTMPPYPWHFGGQSFHNLFLNSDDIISFCNDTGFKICLDVSHSMMACNFTNENIYTFIKKISPYVVHMHIVDAKGFDGEGVQMGEGDVDFVRLGEVLDKYLDNVQFIPEVWQGHTNNGEGFWKALDFLEKKKGF